MSAPPATAFTFEPVFLVVAAGAAAAYVRSARGQPVGVLRPLAFGTGAVLLAAPLNSPLETIAVHSLLSAHLIQNAVIADVAPPLMILGLTPAMRAAIAAALGEPFRRLTLFPVALTVWLGAWYVTHMPVVYDAALRHPGWLNLEHAVMIAAGLIFWWPLISDTPHTPTTPARITYLLLGSFLAAPLSFVYLFADVALYGYYVHRPRLWGISPLRDEHLGGIFMNAEQSIVFLIALAYFFTRWIAEDAAADDPVPTNPPASGRS
jgi:cytochrome c oxidase assembly factor CtaG